MKLTRAVNEYALGKLSEKLLPQIACDALEDGYDSPSLRQLAGTQISDQDNARKLFEKCLIELAMVLPSQVDAALQGALQIAEDVVNGIVAPYEGAKQIWTHIYTQFPCLIQLRGLVGYASEYEDDEKHRLEYEQLIVEECKQLLRKSGPGADN